MKRVILFLGLLILGLAILTFLSGPGGLGKGDEGSGAATPNTPADASQDTPLTAFSPGRGSVAEGMAIAPLEGVSASIPRSAARDGSPLPDMELKVGVLQPNRDGSAALTKPVLTAPSLTGGEPEVSLEALSGRGYFSGTPPTPAAGPWQFNDATIHYRDPKGRLGKLILTCKTVKAQFEEVGGRVSVRTLSSQDSFQVVGDSVRGSGTGFTLDLVKGNYKILKDPSLELRPGATEKMKGFVRLRSKGAATILDGTPVGSPTLDVTFAESGYFRQELDGGTRFFQVEGNALTVRLERSVKDGGKSESFDPKSFDATGDVYFRTQTIEGRCAQAFGTFNLTQVLSDLTIVGPYRTEAKVEKKREMMPGFGSPEILILSGPGIVKAHLADAATEAYRWDAEGSPRISFAEPNQRDPASLTADRMEGTFGKSDLTAFQADHNVVIQSSQGRIVAEHAELTGTDPDRSMTLTSSRGVEMVFSGDVLAPKSRSTPGPVNAASAPLQLNSKKVTFSAVPTLTPGGSRGTRILAEGDVRGKTTDTDGSEITFASSVLETRIGDSSGRRVTLTGAVTASFVARNVKIEGDYLEIHESQSLDSAVASSSLLFRQGELRGNPALLTMGETSAGKRSIFSPHIRFTADRVLADGPVEVMVPADSMAGGTVPRKPGEEPEYVWISGRSLDAALDAAGRPVNATIQGPLDSRGAFAIAGERLTLDFRQGQHSLVGREGVRASIRRPKKAGEPGFYAEAPRMDMEGDSQTLTLAGGGEVVIDGAPMGLQQFGSREAASPAGDNILRFRSTKSVKITPARVSFVGDVKATGEGKDPWSLDSDRLDIDLNESRQPFRVTASGAVVFSVPGRLDGRAEELRFSDTTRLLELDGTRAAPAALTFAGGHFESAWLKCNLDTYLVNAGPGQLSSRGLTARRAGPR